jgi:hypothetical protein
MVVLIGVTLAMAETPSKQVDPYTGRFDNGQVVLELTGKNGQYSGSITIQGATAPVTAQTVGASAQGEMQVNGMVYRFTLTPVEGGLKLTSDGSQYLLHKSGSVSSAAPATPGNAAPAAKPGNSSGIVGYWRNANGYARFNADGTGEIDGQRGRYEIHGNQLTLVGAAGPVTLPFQLQGNALTIIYNGVPVVLNRVLEERGPGSIRPELVGKWCWMSVTNAQQGARTSSRCFVLNPNGTYSYWGGTDSYNPYGGATSTSSDSGTWTATETTITAHSTTSGTHTYTLQKRNHPKTGDPMLVIDGEAFVTYYKKAPW